MIEELSIYELNKVHHADCLEFLKQLPSKSIDCIYLDVPYLHKKGGYGKKSRIARNMKNLQAELKANKISDGFDYAVLDECIRVLKKVNVFIWCSKLQMLDILTYFKKYNFEELVWCKTNPIPAVNNTYLPDVEYCFYFRENNVKLNNGYELKSKFYISPINQDDKKLYDHPTIKPLEFVERHILHATKENDIIFDGYVGSGTTAVACQKNKRHFIGCDNNLKWVEVANDRLKGLTQVDRKLESKGIQNIFDFMEVKD